MADPHVVGLDLSLTATGIATEAGQSIVSCPKLRGIERCDRIAGEVLQLVSQWVNNLNTGLVVIEGYSFGSRNSHAHALGELGGIVRHELLRMGYRWVDVPPSSLKKYATGKGNAGKEEMLAAAIRRLGYDGHDNNEADALWLRAMALDALGCPLVEMPAVNRGALEKVEWPS